MTDFTVTRSSKLADLRAENKRLRGLIREAVITINHAKIFTSTRQKMHPTGQALYEELLQEMKAALDLPEQRK